jgi:hypothetical protein
MVMEINQDLLISTIKMEIIAIKVKSENSIKDKILIPIIRIIVQKTKNNK